MNVLTLSGIPSVNDGSGGRYFIPAGSVGTPVSVSSTGGGSGYNIVISVTTLHFGSNGSFIGYDVANVAVDSAAISFAPATSETITLAPMTISGTVNPS